MQRKFVTEHVENTDFTENRRRTGKDSNYRADKLHVEGRKRTAGNQF